MATKQCDKFEFEDDFEIIEIWNDNLKPPTNTPVTSPYQAPVAWHMKSDRSEKDVYRPILYDVSKSKPNISVFSYGNEPRTKYHHSVHWYSNLSDVLESDSDISVINLGEVPRPRARIKYHHSVHNWHSNLSDVLESDSDISVINLGKVPRTKYHHSVHRHPTLSDVLESDSDISVIDLDVDVPRTKYHQSVHRHPNLSDVLESNSDISVINLGEVPRTKYHQSVHWHPNLSDVFESDSDISVIDLDGEVPGDVYHPNLSDVSKPKSNISVFNFENEQRCLPADLRLHLSDLEEEAGNCPVESESDISLCTWREKPKVVPLVHVPKLDLARLEKSRRHARPPAPTEITNCPVESESDISLCTWREKPKGIPLVHVPKLDFTRLKKSRRRAHPPAPTKITNCPVESESEISLCTWREKPKVIPLVHVPKLDLTSLKRSRRRECPPIKIPVASASEILSVESPEIRSVQKCGFLGKCLRTVCNFFTKCVKG